MLSGDCCKVEEEKTLGCSKASFGLTKVLKHLDQEAQC